MASPKIDVLMGVYEPDKALLRGAVASILGQTWKELRLIICDDGSRDDTYSWLERSAGETGRVLLLRHERNRGLAAALNSCLKYATGDYIARQDADDYSLPDRLEKQAAFLEAHKELAFVGSDLYLFSGRKTWGYKRYPAFPQREDFLFSIPYMHGALMFRREALLACEGYRECRRTRRAEDYELLMRMYALGYRGANLPQPLYAFKEDEAAAARRKYRYRLDETLVRWEGFSRMGILKKGIPYVFKPLAVGLLPPRLLNRLKERRYQLQIQRR